MWGSWVLQCLETASGEDLSTSCTHAHINKTDRLRQACTLAIHTHTHTLKAFLLVHCFSVNCCYQVKLPLSNFTLAALALPNTRSHAHLPLEHTYTTCYVVICLATASVSFLLLRLSAVFCLVAYSICNRHPCMCLCVHACVMACVFGLGGTEEGRGLCHVIGRLECRGVACSSNDI